ncbi:hypothetical protein BUALT_Bualt03G0158500 [Buddleja alternifolia]|uniref:Tyrosinase copper-binding domain-containing protein n=1 Tax=Buddleja alternifolia TaxID=168488 RepID=A0AAV6Y5F3_9LAMI|nr:hypothetical protein BUALT_Bualt03G0158500 [Buddleja alternifolia]
MPSAVVDLASTGSTNPLQLVTNNLTVMYNEMIRANSNVYDFMGNPYLEGTSDTNENTGPGAPERGSHTSVHTWVGDPRQPNQEDLGNFYSAGRDPLFYSHHANVDRMWTLWQYFLPSNKVPDKRITDPDFLNAAFLFYDENAQLVRVTVKDCLDNLRMGYEFERIDLLWLDYRPPPQTSRARVTRVGKSAATMPKIEFPITLDKIVRVLVPKTKKGKADELLVFENITVDTTKFLKFDVFVNDEDDNVFELDKASFAGTYAQVPHKTTNTTVTTSIRLKLTELYEDMDVADDDTVLVTLVPRHHGPGVTIGGIKIIEDTKKATKPSSGFSGNHSCADFDISAGYLTRTDDDALALEFSGNPCSAALDIGASNLHGDDGATSNPIVGKYPASEGCQTRRTGWLEDDDQEGWIPPPRAQQDRLLEGDVQAAQRKKQVPRRADAAEDPCRQDATTLAV